MNAIPVPLNWLEMTIELLADVRNHPTTHLRVSYRIRARVLGSELVKIVADAQKEKKP